jgi:hypothetical protein
MENAPHMENFWKNNNEDDIKTLGSKNVPEKLSNKGEFCILGYSEENSSDSYRVLKSKTKRSSSKELWDGTNKLTGNSLIWRDAKFYFQQIWEVKMKKTHTESPKF